MNKPNIISNVIIKWIMCIVWLIFCIVFFRERLYNLPDIITIEYIIYTLVSGGFLALLYFGVEKIVRLFDKHVEKEENTIISRIIKTDDEKK
ncbi:hypothetical protein AGMMS49975_16490 [Clostridia bacterium]|nr:hypothetical protein AGMMS49975_16370 [Clostridia bacterium]GHU55124.1 hypothetical protein AGMMS49975_16490 [Clostridia bacterium]